MENIPFVFFFSGSFSFFFVVIIYTSRNKKESLYLERATKGARVGAVDLGF
jgi:hypothetical protein